MCGKEVLYETSLVCIKYYFDNFYYITKKWVFNFKINNMYFKDDNSSNADGEYG